MTFDDTFDGDNAELLASIEALQSLAQRNALVPPVPRMPLQLLASTASRLVAADERAAEVLAVLRQLLPTYICASHFPDDRLIARARAALAS